MEISMSPFKLTLLMASVLCAQFSYAQDDVTLETITFKAQGNWLDDANDKKVFEHAGARTILTRDQIDRSAVSNIKDAMKEIPGVQIQENAGTAGQIYRLTLGCVV